jgi:AcrR family transcriptional regulator
MTGPAFLRARRPEQKQLRRDAIRTAARDLAAANGVRNVSLGAVAEAVGLAPSNISRYFATREEIYLELLTEEWRDWTGAVSSGLQQVQGAAAAVVVLAQTLADRPLFCDLLSHLATSLEHNISIPAARDFKHAMHGHVAAMGADIAAATDLTEVEGLELAGLAAGLAGMVYRLANPPPVLVALYAEDPVLAGSRTPLRPTLVRLLSALAAGLPTLRDSGTPDYSSLVDRRRREEAQP